MALRDPEMREWFTQRALEYLIDHVQYIALLDEEKQPLADLPRQPIDWANAERHPSMLSAPEVVWNVPPLFLPRYFGFFRQPVGGPLVDWWEAPNVLTEDDWVHGFEYRTRPQFSIN
jgi:hypothetical protein